jgi:hypothetical protein
VPLIVWGEEGFSDLVGMYNHDDFVEFTKKKRQEHSMRGFEPEDLLEDPESPLTRYDLAPFFYPSDEDLERVGVRGIYLSNYFPWDGLSNFLLAQANGFSSYGNVIEGSAVSYENLDNYQHGIHDYFKFLKFGFGRATDLVSMHIRRGRLTRSQGLDIVKRHDGKYPISYLGKSLKDIIKPLGLDLAEFDKICEKFTNKELFLQDSKGNLRLDGVNLIKINYDNND